MRLELVHLEEQTTCKDQDQATPQYTLFTVVLNHPILIYFIFIPILKTHLLK